MTEKERLDQIEPVIADIARKQDQMLGQMVIIVDHVTANTVEISRLSKRVGNLETDVGTLKSDVAVLKSDVSVLKSDMAVVKSDVSSIKETQTQILKFLEKKFG
jgi:outer membrane murein-binding lipoprotein Lpp